MQKKLNELFEEVMAKKKELENKRRQTALITKDRVMVFLEQMNQKYGEMFVNLYEKENSVVIEKVYEDRTFRFIRYMGQGSKSHNEFGFVLYKEPFIEDIVSVNEHISNQRISTQQDLFLALANDNNWEEKYEILIVEVLTNKIKQVIEELDK